MTELHIRNTWKHKTDRETVISSYAGTYRHKGRHLTLCTEKRKG